MVALILVVSKRIYVTYSDVC
uniref:Uncharacterized protein n=1 Tax=Rhizophora mucronata TaxID=61149 RepID=A0A2P2R2J6_RHIMU